MGLVGPLTGQVYSASVIEGIAIRIKAIIDADIFEEERRDALQDIWQALSSEEWLLVNGLLGECLPGKRKKYKNAFIEYVR